MIENGWDHRCGSRYDDYRVCGLRLPHLAEMTTVSVKEPGMILIVSVLVVGSLCSYIKGEIEWCGSAWRLFMLFPLNPPALDFQYGNGPKWAVNKRIPPASECKTLGVVVVPLGLEPRTPWLWVRCSNQLSYRTDRQQYQFMLHVWDCNITKKKYSLQYIELISEAVGFDGSVGSLVLNLSWMPYSSMGASDCLDDDCG